MMPSAYVQCASERAPKRTLGHGPREMFPICGTGARVAKGVNPACSAGCCLCQTGAGLLSLEDVVKLQTTRFAAHPAQDCISAPDRVIYVDRHHGRGADDCKVPMSAREFLER